MDALIVSHETTANFKQHCAGALPLYMLLSKDERNLTTECSSFASHPSHKCTPKCTQRINGGERQRKEDTSAVVEGKNIGKEYSYMKSPKSPRAVPLIMFVSPNGRNLNPKCPNASNPYHKCTERCIQKMNEEKKTSERDPSVVIESSKKSYLRSPETTKKKNVSTGFLSIFSPDIRNVGQKCPNADNPFHKCTETCIQKMNAGKKQREGEASAAIGKNIENSYEKRSRSPLRLPISMFASPNKQNVIPKCPYESNPYHKCNERCMERMNEGKMQSKGEKSEERKTHESLTGASTPSRKITNSPNRRNVHPMCPNASNPYHKCTETCLQRLNNKGKEQNESNTAAVIVVSKEEKMEKDIDAFTPCMEIFYITSPRSRESKKQEAGQVDASDPCQKCTEGKKQSVSEKAVGIENNEETDNGEGKMDVNPKHLDASDSKSNSTKRSLSEDHGSVEKEEESNEGAKGINDNYSEEIKKVIAVEEKVYGQPTCIDASNQYQNYDVDCQFDEDEGSKKERNDIVPGAERSIDDYFKRVNNTDVVKGGDSVELAKERKEDVKIAEGNYEQSQCKNVSKPYHKCNEQCFSRISKREKAKEEKSQTVHSSLRFFCFFRVNSRKSS